jgi:hypothetical protein
MALKDKYFINFIDRIDNQETVSFYRDKLIDRINETSKEQNRLELYLILSIVVYYLIKNTGSFSIQIGPLGLNDLQLATSLIPPIYTYLLIGLLSNYNFIEIQKHNLRRTLEKRGNFLSEELDSLTSIITPFEVSAIFNYLDFENTKKVSVLNFLLLIPLVFLLLAAILGFEIFWIYDLYTNWSTSFAHKISLIITLWLLLILFFTSYTAVRNSIEHKKRTNLN